MGFARRTVVEGGIYHVMNRGASRQAVFFADADRVEFGRLLQEIHERWSIDVLAYCLMENHFHLLLRCPDGELSRAMQHLSSVYTRHTNERIGRDGPLFRGRFRSLHVDTDRYLLAAVRYIHANALDLPGVRSVTDYRWSSHRTYLGKRRRPDFLDTAVVLRYFDGDRDRFDRFVRDADPHRTARLESGDLTFVQRIVELAIADSEELDGSRSAAQLSRTLSLLIADELPDPLGRRLVDELDFANDASRRAARSRARRRSRELAEVATLLANVRRQLGVSSAAA